MINYIEGDIISIRDNIILVRTNNIGYNIICSSRLLNKVVSGDYIKLFVELFIAQQISFHLYGFETEEERLWFLELKNKTNLSKKVLINIISHNINDIINAINEKDIGFFQNIDGIGKKSAESLITEMKNSKLLEIKSVSPSRTSIDPDLLELLKNLGLDTKKHLDIIKKFADSNLSEAEIIKQIILEANSSRINSGA